MHAGHPRRAAAAGVGHAVAATRPGRHGLDRATVMAVVMLVTALIVNMALRRLRPEVA
ncbi:MAG: hypothetical protein R2851_16955 [Caldilineaceae bacterium]